MKRFLLGSAVVAISFVTLWVNVVPVHCDVCKQTMFRTSFTATLCGHDYPVVHASCVDWFNPPPSQFPAIRIPVAQASGTSPGAPLAERDKPLLELGS